MANSTIDYTSRDYDGLRQSLLDYASQVFPEWTPGSEGDFGVLMLEMLAYVGDVNSYYVDRAQREAHLGTASQRESVLQIANLLGYRPSNGSPATGTVTLKSDPDSAPVPVPAGTRLATDFINEIDGQVIFETDTDVYVPANGGTVTVPVTEGETKREEVSGAPQVVGESNGLPDQRFRLQSPKVYDNTTRIWVADEEWFPVDDLLSADPAEKAFATSTDQDGYTWIHFGDGLNGAVPSLGLPITGTYRVGQGARGNIEAGRVVSVYESSLSGVSLEQDANDSTRTTSSAMTGGADPESTESIRSNAPRVFRTQQRAITLEDYENFALGIPGVAKAKALAETYTSVTVYVVGPDGSTPTDNLIAQVTRELERRSLTGVSITVGPPTFVALNIGSSDSPVSVEVWPNYARGSVQQAVDLALRDRLAFHANELGARVNVSDIYKTIMSVDGVRYVDIPTMNRSDTAQTGNNEIQLRPWEFPVAGDIVLTSTGGIN